MQHEQEKGGNWRFGWKRSGGEYVFHTHARLYPALVMAFMAFLFTAILLREPLLILLSFALLIMAKATIKPGLIPTLKVAREGLTIKKTSIKWGNLLSVITLPHRGKGRMLRLSYRKAVDEPVQWGDMYVGQDKAGQWLVGMLQKGAQKSAALRAHILEEMEATTYQFGPMSEYRGWKLSDEGMRRGIKRIAWESIKGLGTEARDNALAIYYDGKKGLERLLIKDRSRPRRRRFMKLLLSALPLIEVDAALLNSIGEKKKEAEAIDTRAAVMIILSLVLAVIGCMAVGSYTFNLKDSASAYLYVPIGFWVLGLLAGLVGMMGTKDDKARATKAARRMARICLGAGPAGIVAFFMLYPGGSTWLVADAYKRIGDYEQAQGKYEECLKISPDSKYLLFDLGKNSHSLRQWEETLSYFEKGYAADPKFREAGHVMHVPDALIQLGRQEEAREYCLMHYKKYPEILTNCDDLPKKMKGFRALGFSPVKITLVNSLKRVLLAGEKRQKRKPPEGTGEESPLH